MSGSPHRMAESFIEAFVRRYVCGLDQARFLTLIAWGGVGVLIFLLYRVAHFYQVTSGQPTRYQLFLIPLTLLVLGGSVMPRSPTGMAM